MYWCVFVLPFRLLLPHTRFPSLAHKNDALMCVFIVSKAASWYVTYVTPESMYGERESISEDNANTYFEPLFLMSTTYSTSTICCLQAPPYRYVYDLPQYPFSARIVLSLARCVYMCVFFRHHSPASTMPFLRLDVYSIECSVCLDADNGDKGVCRLPVINIHRTPSRDIPLHMLSNSRKHASSNNVQFNLDFDWLFNVSWVRLSAN